MLSRHPRLNVDEDAGRIVYTELVANVLQHAPGRIEITLEVDGTTATLVVRDSGPGFVNAKLSESLMSERGREGLQKKSGNLDVHRFLALF